MKNQRSKVKHENGSRVHSPRQVAQMTMGLLGKFPVSFFNGRYGNFQRARNKRKTKVQKLHRKINQK